MTTPATPPPPPAPPAAAQPQPPDTFAGPPRGVRERRDRLVGWRSRDVLRATLLVLLVYVAARLVWVSYQLLFVAFLGVLFGLAASGPVGWLNRRLRIPRGLASFIVVFGVVGAIGGIGAWSAPTIREQSRELRTKLPEAIDKIEQWVQRRQGGFVGSMLGLGGPVAKATGGVAAAATGGGGAAQPARADSVRAAGGAPQPQPPPAGAQPGAAEGGLRDRVGGQFSGARRYIMPVVSSTFAVVSGFILIMFLAIYIAADPDTYHAGLMHLFPHRARRRAGEVLSEIAAVLRQWLRAQLIAMVVIGAVSTAAFLALGIPAAVPLGIIAGLFEFIPTVGPIISSIPAIAMGFVESPQQALVVAGVCGLIQFLENQLLIPKLMQKSVDIPPVLTILGQAFMALIFGFPGLLVAVPMLAAAMVAVKMLYVQDVVGDQIGVTEQDDDDDDD